MPLKFIQSASSSGVATPLEKSQQVAEGLHVIQPLAHLLVIALILMMIVFFSGDVGDIFPSTYPRQWVGQ